MRYIIIFTIYILGENSLIAQEDNIEKYNYQINYGGGVIDLNGNQYKSVIIGNQEWMAENLRSSKYNNGKDIDNVIDPDQWINLNYGAWCYYDNDSQNNKIYGKLYNWFAINSGMLCPTGWHVPSDSEWTLLLDYLKNNGYLKAEGVALKSKSDWTDGKDYLGWKGLPGGTITSKGEFTNISYYGYWWTSSSDSEEVAWSRELYDLYYGLDKAGYYKSSGKSVRCIKD